MALAEVLNEHVESAVGELLSTVGRFQAEQPKQIQEFQEEVLDRARKAKEQATREALEALEAQRFASKPASVAENVTATNTYTVIPVDTGPSTASRTDTEADSATKVHAKGASNDG